ncbi:hypothetical protein GCM10011578_080840 [Streptomyces fuscichromogenes]|uniref:Uncharacterized protein n=1 Tax=Streptomyces fuscichromogenes TaxID=1324013 RepID=A0A918CVW8_9ACTN|nr:hypothetical protein GCM10011578_080840 [Streptomyces fuscichromogenes]
MRLAAGTPAAATDRRDRIERRRQLGDVVPAWFNRHEGYRRLAGILAYGAVPVAVAAAPPGAVGVAKDWRSAGLSLSVCWAASQPRVPRVVVVPLPGGRARQTPNPQVIHQCLETP